MSNQALEAAFGLSSLSDNELIVLQKAIEARLSFKPKTIEDFTNEEIRLAISRLLSSAKEYYEAKINKDPEYDFEDAPQYIFEDVMGLLGEGVWKVINKIY